MQSWFIPAFIALLVYGLWEFFPKLAVRYLSLRSALVWEVAGVLLVGLGILAAGRFQVEFHPRGVLFAVLAGVCGMIGTLFFFAAARHGKISVVVSLTALYTLVTIVLAVLLLGERLSLRQGIGMLLALIAIILMSS